MVLGVRLGVQKDIAVPGFEVLKCDEKDEWKLCFSGLLLGARHWASAFHGAILESPHQPLRQVWV